MFLNKPRIHNVPFGCGGRSSAYTEAEEGEDGKIEKLHFEDGQSILLKFLSLLSPLSALSSVPTMGILLYIQENGQYMMSLQKGRKGRGCTPVGPIGGWNTIRA